MPESRSLLGRRPLVLQSEPPADGRVTENSVATWNLHQAVDKRPDNIARTWAYLETTIVPTIALVQEALTVAATGGGNVASRSDAGYSTAVVGYGAEVAPLGTCDPPHCAGDLE